MNASQLVPLKLFLVEIIATIVILLVLLVLIIIIIIVYPVLRIKYYNLAIV
jgi:hypothetical protein